jgi:hypothetical protein
VTSLLNFKTEVLLSGVVEYGSSLASAEVVITTEFEGEKRGKENHQFIKNRAKTHMQCSFYHTTPDHTMQKWGRTIAEEDP